MLYYHEIGGPTKVKVKFICRQSCSKYLPKLCGGDTPSPSVAPSNSEVSMAPSLTLSSSPSIAPSKSDSESMPPSSAPTLVCADDDTFEFQIITGETKDCEWISESVDRIDAY